jgi:hypothetical protein
MKQTTLISHRSVLAFAQEHDDLPAFRAAYLLLTVLAAAMFNFGFFIIIIAIHMALDVYKYHVGHRFGWGRTAEGVMRESIVDISLLLMGLTVAIYLHPSLTVLVGIKGMMLAELTILRGIGIITPKLKILYKSVKILRGIDEYVDRMHPRFGNNLSLIEYVCMFSVCVSVGMIVIAPLLLMLSNEQYLFIIIDQLVPWKM